MNKIKLFGSENPRAAAGKARWLVMVCLLMPMTMSGQEMIRRIYNATSDVTFARTMTSYDRWVVYNDNNKMSLFGRMDTSGYGNVFVKTEQHINVNDIELVDQTLYFCGSMYNNDENVRDDVGVMGYINTNDFNNPSSMQVHYIFFNEFIELKKLAYYSKERTNHVAMVGTGKDSVDYIVDAFKYIGGDLPSSFVWQRAWMDLPNYDAVFDDIIEYENDIVVSARVEDTTEVQICFIEKTPLMAVPFFITASLETVKIPEAPLSSVLLQKTRGNLYAFYRNGPYLDVCQFSGRINNQSYHIPILHTMVYFPEYFNLKDVCVDIDRRDEISVLISKTDYESTKYLIYHIPQSLFPVGGTVYAHEYGFQSPYTPKSLCGGKNYHTVTMGTYMDNWGMSRVVNYKFEHCSGKIESKTTEKKLGIAPIGREYRLYDGRTELLKMEVSVRDYNVIQECGSYALKKEEEKQ